MSDAPRAQLIHIETDRRLGHEWDEWDGSPLPNGGNFDAPGSLFFGWSALVTGLVLAAGYGVILLLKPHLATLHPSLPRIALAGLAVVAAVLWSWWILLLLTWLTGRPLLPERLAERGPFLRLMRLTSRLAGRFGRRDWVENASVKVFNALALLRNRKLTAGTELLLLVPRCLSRETLDGVLAVAGRYAVPVFVATRGQLARRAIRERRPKAVVAVACERDMVSGLHDVAGRVPVLGLTMQLPKGPCRDAVVDLGQLDQWMKAYLA
jgi:hypothetical protein